MHTPTWTYTPSSIWELQGIIEQAGVNEFVIIANSICHWDQGWPVASARGAVCVTVCGKYRGCLPKWTIERRSFVLLLKGINLTAVALRFRTQLQLYPEGSLNELSEVWDGSGWQELQFC